MRTSIIPTLAFLLLFGCQPISGQQLTVMPSPTASNQALTDVYQQFAFSLYQQVAATIDKNLCFSPLSAQLALSMMQNGAAGTTLEQMQATLGTTSYSNEEVNLYNQQLTEKLTTRETFWVSPEDEDAFFPICELANGIWARTGTQFFESFYQTMHDYYNAYVGSVDFTTQEGVDEVDAWMNEQTHGLIPQVLGQPQSSDLAMLLANALYFKGSWTVGFEEEATVPGTFHLSDGTDVETLMMNTWQSFQTSETDRFRTVTLTYGMHGDFTMTLFLPREEVSDAQLTLDDWKAAFSGKGKGVHLSMPRFSIEGKQDLKPILSSMGMPDAFNRYTADFSNMYDLSLFIGQCFQLNNITVDEAGTEAAAVTVIMAYDSAVEPGPTEYEEFAVDRPFFFTIENRTAPAILFIGRVNTVETEGISSVASLPLMQSGHQVHDLQGRRLNTEPAKGIYIKDGKKWVR